MKLPDFRQNEEFNDLRKRMGADLSSFEIDGIPLKKIQPNPTTGTLEFNGSMVIVYIRDQYTRDQEVLTNLDPGQLRKFHVADCATLQEMRRKGKFERYVVTNRTDGKFTVNFLDGFAKKLIKEGIVCQLHACMNCLRRLNYHGYCKSKHKNEIRNTFEIKEFFDKYSSQITTKPKYTDETAPVNVYTEYWEQVSLRFREKAGWKCSKCQDYLGEDSKKRFLHVHHINGLKYNNSDDNLQVLCIMCHADIDDQLKPSPDYAKYQEIRQFREPV